MKIGDSVQWGPDGHMGLVLEIQTAMGTPPQLLVLLYTLHPTDGNPGFYLRMQDLCRVSIDGAEKVAVALADVRDTILVLDELVFKQGYVGYYKGMARVFFIRTYNDDYWSFFRPRHLMKMREDELMQEHTMPSQAEADHLDLLNVRAEVRLLLKSNGKHSASVRVSMRTAQRIFEAIRAGDPTYLTTTASAESYTEPCLTAEDCVSAVHLTGNCISIVGSMVRPLISLLGGDFFFYSRAVKGMPISGSMATSIIDAPPYGRLRFTFYPNTGKLTFTASLKTEVLHVPATMRLLRRHPYSEVPAGHQLHDANHPRGIGALFTADGFDFVVVAIAKSGQMGQQQREFYLPPGGGKKRSRATQAQVTTQVLSLQLPLHYNMAVEALGMSFDEILARDDVLAAVTVTNRYHNLPGVRRNFAQHHAPPVPAPALHLALPEPPLPALPAPLLMPAVDAVDKTVRLTQETALVGLRVQRGSSTTLFGTIMGLGDSTSRRYRVRIKWDGEAYDSFASPSDLWLSPASVASSAVVGSAPAALVPPPVHARRVYSAPPSVLQGKRERCTKETVAAGQRVQRGSSTTDLGTITSTGDRNAKRFKVMVKWDSSLNEEEVGPDGLWTCAENTINVI